MTDHIESREALSRACNNLFNLFEGEGPTVSAISDGLREFLDPAGSANGPGVLEGDYLKKAEFLSSHLHEYLSEMLGHYEEFEWQLARIKEASKMRSRG